MMRLLAPLDRHLVRLTLPYIMTLAMSGVLIIGWLDYLIGYEVGVSLFYLGPVALAAWYAGRLPGVAIAFLSCVSWFVADLAAGNQYSHPAIAVWNAFIRFGFFLITGVLLNALHTTLRAQFHLAKTDSLTGLYGRRVFDDRLKHDIASGQRRKSALTLAYVDVDDFKAVNDTHGHAGGDRVLREIGRVLKGSLRETDTAARVGGDEFALILPDTDGIGAQRAISRFTSELHNALEASVLGVTCSIGVVTFLDSATSSEHALAAADKLMYEVKNKGKGAVAFSVLGQAA